MNRKTYRLTSEEAQLLKKMEQASGLNGTQLFKKKMFEEQQGLELLEIKVQQEIKRLEDKMDLRFAQNAKLLTKLFDALNLIADNIKR